MEPCVQISLVKIFVNSPQGVDFFKLVVHSPQRVDRFEAELMLFLVDRFIALFVMQLYGFEVAKMGRFIT